MRVGAGGGGCGEIGRRRNEAYDFAHRRRCAARVVRVAGVDGSDLIGAGAECCAGHGCRASAQIRCAQLNGSVGEEADRSCRCAASRRRRYCCREGDGALHGNRIRRGFDNRRGRRLVDGERKRRGAGCVVCVATIGCRDGVRAGSQLGGAEGGLAGTAQGYGTRAQRERRAVECIGKGD